MYVNRTSSFHRLALGCLAVGLFTSACGSGSSAVDTTQLLTTESTASESTATTEPSTVEPSTTAPSSTQAPTSVVSEEPAPVEGLIERFAVALLADPGGLVITETDARCPAEALSALVFRPPASNSS